MLAITFSTEFTFPGMSGEAAMARQVVVPELLWMRKLSGGSVTFMPANMNVIVGGEGMGAE